MKLFKRVALGLVALIVVLALVLTVNTLRYSPKSTDDVEQFEMSFDLDQAAQHLSEAIQIRTVATGLDSPEFPRFLEYLEESFPKVHATMQRQVLEPNTPLYLWEGRDASLAPVLMAAHYDVVPVSLASLKLWDHPPYAGAIADGHVWGRGALDDKGALIAILTAAEELIAAGYQPERSIYLSFGGDEEVGGTGAQAVAAYLNNQGIQLDWALDEGSFVLDGIVPGLEVPVASINLSEKGYLNLTLIARAEGGHSSLPPRETAVGRIGHAVARLQDNPVAGGLDGVSAEFFTNLGQYFPLSRRVVFANHWLFRPVLEGILSGAPSTDAMLRTTTAPTMLSGSVKENVLATEATATINFRIHPRDTIEDVVAHVRNVIQDDQIEIVPDREFAANASPVASSEAQGFKDIEAAVLSVFGDVATVPGLTIAATDARHYAAAAKNTYRINPFTVVNEDIARIHGINERLSLENLSDGIRFYGALMSKQ